jgi:hypothetical protein
MQAVENVSERKISKVFLETAIKKSRFKYFGIVACAADIFGNQIGSANPANGNIYLSEIYQGYGAMIASHEFVQIVAHVVAGVKATNSTALPLARAVVSVDCSDLQKSGVTFTT